MPGYTVTVTESREAYERRRAADPGAYRNQGVEHHQADTPEEMLERVADICIERFGGGPGPEYAASGYPDATRILKLHAAGGRGSLKLPDGSTISVKPDEEGR